MSRKPRIVDHLSLEDLHQRYREAHDPVERSHYQMLWLLSCGESVASCAQRVGYSSRWVSEVLARYNADGPSGLGDGRHHNRGQEPLLSLDLQEELRQAMKEEPAEGGLWSGPKVASWIGRKLGRDDITAKRGWVYLKKLGFSLQVPRPAHEGRASAEEQAGFKKNSLNGLPRSRKSTATRWSRPGPSTSTASA
jgi:transposase